MRIDIVLIDFSKVCLCFIQLKIGRSRISPGGHCLTVGCSHDIVLGYVKMCVLIDCTL